MGSVHGVWRRALFKRCGEVTEMTLLFFSGELVTEPGLHLDVSSSEDL